MTRRSSKQALHILRGINSSNLIFFVIFVFEFLTMLTDLSLGSEKIRCPLSVTAMSDGLFPDLVLIDFNNVPWRLKSLTILSSALDHISSSLRQNTLRNPLQNANFVLIVVTTFGFAQNFTYEVDELDPGNQSSRKALLF